MIENDSRTLETVRILDNVIKFNDDSYVLCAEVKIEKYHSNEVPHVVNWTPWHKTTGCERQKTPPSPSGLSSRLVQILAPIPSVMINLLL